MYVDDFKEFYHSDKLAVPVNWSGSVITYVEFASYSEIFAMVLNRWNKFEPFLRRMIDVMHRQPHEDAKIVVNEIRHHRFLLLEAKLSFDGILFYQNYHGVLQTVLRACFRMGSPEAFLFRKQIGDLQQIALRKFDHAVDAKGESSDGSRTAEEEERSSGENSGGSGNEDVDGERKSKGKNGSVKDRSAMRPLPKAAPSPSKTAEMSTSEDDDHESPISSGGTEMADDEHDDEISGEDRGEEETRSVPQDDRRVDPIMLALQEEEEEGPEPEPTEDTEEYQPRKESGG
jgi:hypothetical protein